MFDLKTYCQESTHPVLNKLTFEVGYLVFPGSEPPNNREEAVQRLRDLGFVQGTQTHIAGAILDGNVEELMPQVKMIVQVGQNQFCGYALVVHPLQAVSDKRGVVAKTYAGCEFRDDVFMIVE